MTKEEWLERYAARFVTVGALDIDAARDFAANAVPFTEASDGYEDDPEGAADMEMSYWEAE